MSARLTPARRRALAWFRDNDGAKLFPISVSRSVIRGLVINGLLQEQKPEFGFVRTFITESGRRALATTNPSTNEKGTDSGVAQP